jgi:small conductance mechanosensitive channel
MKNPFADSEVALSVLVIIASTLVLWLLLIRAASRARRHFAALLAITDAASDDAQHDVETARRRLTALRLLVNAAQYGLVISALLMTLRRLNAPLDSLLLPAGFLGAALGLGAQNLVRDVVAGLFIVFEGQFAVGDVVRINNVVGTVDQIGLRVTSLRDEAGHKFLFPNGAITAIETFPRRHCVMLLVSLGEMPDGKSIEDVRQTVTRALELFDDDYSVLSGTTDVQATHDRDRHRLCLRLPVRPLRGTLLREKLPARVASALERAGYFTDKTAAGVEVEIFNAPAAAEAG